MRICFVSGARPNLMKIAALYRATTGTQAFERFLVHTGQHYDDRLSRLLFEELGLPKPDVDLGVGSASHAVQTAEIMRRFEPVLLRQAPDLVAVVGDTNSTMACALVAAKLRVPLAHVEAGLRSFDRRMPEELNRIVTDALSDLLFVSEPSGLENLRREGVPDRHVHFVGNTMIDTLLEHRERADASDVLDRLGLKPRTYAVLTLHRPSNVDDAGALTRIASALGRVAEQLPVVFPVHPRTRRSLAAAGLWDTLEEQPGFALTEPMLYLDFLKLIGEARLVLTDSGGIQEETTVLGVPCLTLRENTERPVTLECGLNRLVGTAPERIEQGVRDALAGRMTARRRPEKWDGRAGVRIVEVLLSLVGEGLPRR